MPFLEAALNSRSAWSLTVGWESGNQLAMPHEIRVWRDWQKHARAQGCHLTKVYGMLTLKNQLPCFLRAHRKVCWGGSHQCGNKEGRKL